MALTHADYHYSVTIHSDDLAVVYCLRALAKYSQKTENQQIPWGGTKDPDWKRDQHEVTFHFSSPEYRQSFVSEIERLLPRALWRLVGQRGDDPAVPQ